MAENNYPSVSKINLRELHRATDTTENVISWCRQHGLLSKQQNCSSCEQPMKFCLDLKKRDKIRWRCSSKTCKKELSIRHGSFFGRTHLELSTILDVLYYYSYETASIKKLKHECQMANEAIVNWRNFVKSIYAEYFVGQSVAIGGSEHVVEIFESFFLRRNRDDKKSLKLTTHLVFGGFDRHNQESFLVIVDENSAITLLPVLQVYVLPGTTVVSSLWEKYNTMGNPNFKHLITNRKLHFVGTETNISACTFESILQPKQTGKKKIKREYDPHESTVIAKKRIKKDFDTDQPCVHSLNLIEYMWRKKFGDDPFENLLRHIREIYPLS